MLDATPLLRLYGFRRRRQLAALEPAAAQNLQLLSLVSRARDTRFGRDHDFFNIRTVADFQKTVPLRTYDAFWDRYWEPGFPRLTDCTCRLPRNGSQINRN